MRLITIAAATILSVGALPLAAQVALARGGFSFASDSEVRSILRARVDDKRSAGVVVGMLAPDGTTRFVAAGDPGPGQPPLDSNSVFEIGSITKVFTSTVLAQMVQEGRVRLDDPAQNYLPAGVHMPTLNGKAITLGNLSEQNSGLPYMPTNLRPANAANPFADYSVQQMYDMLNGYVLTREPGARFEYSNLGVGLLGHILALIDGKPYEQMVRDRIWTPLGMTHTAIVFTPEMRRALALGHNGAGDVVANWDLTSLAGAGAIRSTASDMLKFADANLHPERGPLQRAMVFAQQPRSDMAPSMRIGLNWITLQAPTDTIVWHNGGTAGYRTYLGLLPSRKAAVIVLTNSGGAGADDIGMHLLVPSLPLAPKPAPMKQRVAIDVASATLGQFVGTYAFTPTFQLEVSVTDGALYAQATGQPRFRLFAESENEFFFRVVDAQITFVRDEKGVVTSLILHQGGQNPEAKKVR